LNTKFLAKAPKFLSLYEILKIGIPDIFTVVSKNYFIIKNILESILATLEFFECNIKFHNNNNFFIQFFRYLYQKNKNILITNNNLPLFEKLYDAIIYKRILIEYN
jgi:hypothetical protein